jgi:hypothetical protein
VPTRFKWSLISDERLLDTRICDLPVRIKGSFLEPYIKRLYNELNERSIRFKPHVWLSEEFFTPDGVPGFAIPFYLAHPRLMKLERKQMLKVEGSTEAECMRILRHEAGHSLSNAYRLHFKRRWIRLFGSNTQPYPSHYNPRPASRRYVFNLDAWYAQAHPAEDFAETFAVWLQPHSNWRRRYRGWPAMRKLEYVDELMNEIGVTRPKNLVRRKVDRLPEVRTTLREHYRRKRRQYELAWPAYIDNDLRRVFSNEARYRSRATAGSFLRSMKRELVDFVSEGTGVHQYAIDHLVEKMIDRTGHLKLRVARSRADSRDAVLIMVTTQTMNMFHSGLRRIPL